MRHARLPRSTGILKVFPADSFATSMKWHFVQRCCQSQQKHEEHVADVLLICFKFCYCAFPLKAIETGLLTGSLLPMFKVAVLVPLVAG